MKFDLSKFIGQVKLENVTLKVSETLFKKFKLEKLLKECEITKDKGSPIILLLTIMLLTMLSGSRSVYCGIKNSLWKKYKNPISTMLNNAYYDWDKLLYKIAIIYSKLHSNKADEFSIIFDDSSKKKFGFKTEFSGIFWDHCSKNIFWGFQNVVMGFYDGVRCIPLAFASKIGKKKIKKAKRAKAPRGSRIAKKITLSKKQKNEICIEMLKEAIKQKIRFAKVIWDTWFTNNTTMSYVFGELVPRGIHMVGMLKKSAQKFKLNDLFLDFKELYHKAGVWQIDEETGIKFKTIIVGLLDTKSAHRIKDRTVLGQIKICFYRYPGVRKYKMIITTDLKLSALEVLSVYLRRWSIEVMFRDLKMYFGYDQYKTSKYCAMNSDLSIRCIFYILFCHRKEMENYKSTEECVFNFFNEISELVFYEIIELVLKKKLFNLLDKAEQMGYKTISELKANLDNFLELYFKNEWYVDKIVDISCVKNSA
ncbi:MAG: hypothetical protein K8S23_06785 [Candidatus Cloacimonetes bacterium]|nr:hypothetical protein [Candidatus Cloacimonadota bacterium]